MDTKLQKCAGKSPTDYWGRLLAESLTVDESRDQPILRAIQRTNNNQLSLPDFARQLVESKEFSSRFQHFGQTFDEAKLQSLASALYEIVREKFGRNYQRDDVAGFFEVWRLMGTSDAARHDPDLRAWALDELLKSLPNYIHFANELYYFWLGGPHAEPTQILPVRQKVLATLKASLEGQTSPSLCDCLNENFPYNLFHLLYTSNYQEKSKGMAPLSDDADWAWLKPNILAACHKCPTRMLPQVIVAIQDNSRNSDMIVYEYDQQRLKVLFGEDVEELLGMIAAGFTINPVFNQKEITRMELAVEKAKQLLTSAP